MVKPLIKWVGGKTQLLEELFLHFPETINNYHEIFLGGGSVLFELLSAIKRGDITLSGNIFAYDVNENLIYMYKNIQSNPDEFYAELEKYKKKYNDIAVFQQVREVDDNGKKKRPITNFETEEEAKTSKESYYYWLRKEFNKIIKSETEKSSIRASVLLVFLNKTCFRGLYRIGPNGFNVPFGNYKTTPGIVTLEELREMSCLIQRVSFECLDFTDSISRVDPDDFMYLDPPYYPEQATSFVNYVGDGFNEKQHKNLFTLIQNKAKSGVTFVLSNSNVKNVKDQFTEYTIEEIDVKRSIHSKNPGVKTKEVLIYN